MSRACMKSHIRVSLVSRFWPSPPVLKVPIVIVFLAAFRLRFCCFLRALVGLLGRGAREGAH